MGTLHLFRNAPEVIRVAAGEYIFRRGEAAKVMYLIIEGEVNRTGMGIYDMMSGIGAHEVIVETPRHNENIPDLSDEHVEKILWAYKQRIVDLEKDKRFRYILVFKNYGTAAGASLSHPHSQLIATPITPRYVKMELTNSRDYFQEKERCIFCDIVRQELSVGNRTVMENEHFVVIAPFAPRFPFETWVLPKKHSACFEQAQTPDFESLAKVMKNVLQRLDKVLNIPPYNFMVHTAPLRDQVDDYYHWHLEIIPKLTKVAGFEWGSGFYLNPTSPEEAAKFLRDAKLD